MTAARENAIAALAAALCRRADHGVSEPPCEAHEIEADELLAGLAPDATPDMGHDETPGLDAAWKEAEAALPEGWAITMVWGTITEDRWAASAAPWPSETGKPFAIAGGPTPAEALRNLAARLAAQSQDR